MTAFTLILVLSILYAAFRSGGNPERRSWAWTLIGLFFGAPLLIVLIILLMA